MGAFVNSNIQSEEYQVVHRLGRMPVKTNQINRINKTDF